MRLRVPARVGWFEVSNNYIENVMEIYGRHNSPKFSIWAGEFYLTDGSFSGSIRNLRNRRCLFFLYNYAIGVLNRERSGACAEIIR